MSPVLGSFDFQSLITYISLIHFFYIYFVYFQRANKKDRAGYLWYKTKSLHLKLVFLKKFKQINNILWLFNVLCPISTAPQFKQRVKRSSLHIYIKHEINLNEQQTVFSFNLGKTSIHIIFQV